jgi:uncharacterized membrane protein
MDELEALIAFVGIAALLIVIAVPYLLISQSSLKARVRGLEAVVQRLQQDPSRASQAPPVPAGSPLVVAPIPAAAMPEPPAARPAALPRARIIKPGLIASLLGWLRENWVLAVAAASLALAGVFMVQYGIENGLLTPFWRVMGALAFGAALIAGGEYIRRVAGDDLQDGDGIGATRFLPSTLSGAGIIVLYTAVFAARALYGLIDPVPMLIGLTFVSALALVLGWFYGPYLAAVGILGATLAPFITGSSSGNAWMVHYYLALVAIVALGIDTVRRWAWVSSLGLIATLGASLLLYAGAGADLHLLAGTLIIAFASVAIPERGLTPRQSGPALLDAVVARGRVLPAFPTRLTLGAVFATTLAALWVQSAAPTPDTTWAALLALSLLIAATTIWTRQAPALYDHVLIPGIAFLAAIALESTGYGRLFAAFQAAARSVADGPAPPIPMTVWALTAIGAAGTLLMFTRIIPGHKTATFWAFASAIFAPATLLLLEFLWSPGDVLGPYPWALAAIALAGLMTWLATRAAAPDGLAPLRMGLFAVGALTLITLAFFLVLTRSSLTVALAVMVLGTAWLDRRTPLPPLSVFLQIAVAVITFRLVFWPGIIWATDWDYINKTYDAPYFEVAFAYLATLALLTGAWVLARDHRAKTALVLESACWTGLGLFLVVTLIRAAPRDAANSHWMLGLMGTIWVALALNQLYRIRGGSRFMTGLRAATAGVYALTALWTIGLMLTEANPLWGFGNLVVGPPILDSLALAFLPLAAVFAVAALKIPQFGKRVQIGFVLAASGFATLYIGMEVRRLWRGPDLSVPGFSDPELYSYTLAMLIASVALLILAFARRSDMLRKIAMAGVALTIAKVFLVDTSGLAGLIRVVSFMGLGLSLVALTWLNRKMTAQWDRRPAPKVSPGPSP